MNKTKQKPSNFLTWTLVSHLMFWNAYMVFKGPIKSISCIVCVHINRLKDCESTASQMGGFGD